MSQNLKQVLAHFYILIILKVYAGLVRDWCFKVSKIKHIILTIDCANVA